MPTPLRILIVSDGRPGHFNLSEGIAAALGRKRQTVMARLAVRRGRWPGRAAAWITRSGLPPRLVLQLIYGIGAETVPAADVVVSAGAETMPASIAIARLRSIPNLHYGSLRQFRAKDFALVLTSYAGNAGRPRHAFAAKPAPFDPDTFGPPADPRRWPAGLPPTIGLAIGGDAAGCRFETADWDALVTLISGTATRHGVRWIVSNSRRTAPALSDRLATLAGEPESPIAQFVDVRDPAAPRLWQVFGTADAILVTADSSSMVSEGVFARRPVIALTPERLALSADETAYRAALAGDGRLATAAIRSLDADRLAALLRTVTPYAGNPLDDLAALIAARVPQLAPAHAGERPL
ncbi:MAG: ELM1/GtrOC1 family putative glycosyltransferase [Hyphomicrobiaceae bacterium]